MIEVKNLYKSFGDKKVLHDINTVFEDGKTNLIIGQSGAGKNSVTAVSCGIVRAYKWRSTLRPSQLCSDE